MQLKLFEFQNSYSYKYIDYILLEQNRDVYNFLMNDFTWSTFLLYGSVGTGKTHLANIWKKLTGSVFIECDDCSDINSVLAVIDNSKSFIIEDIDKLNNDNFLLHCYNYIKEMGKRLLMTSSCPPRELNFKLNDLNSRILATMNASLADPDEELLRVMLIKQFSDRQFHVDLKVINYILKNIERSFVSLRNVVQIIDQSIGTDTTVISIPFVRSIMQKYDL